MPLVRSLNQEMGGNPQDLSSPPPMQDAAERREGHPPVKQGHPLGKHGCNTCAPRNREGHPLGRHAYPFCAAGTRRLGRTCRNLEVPHPPPTQDEAEGRVEEDTASVRKEEGGAHLPH